MAKGDNKYQYGVGRGVLLLLITFLDYLPIYYYPDFLNEIYFNYKILILIVSAMTLLISLYFSKKKYLVITLLSIYLTLWLSSDFIQNIKNISTITYNQNKEPSNFRSPFLGYKIFFPKENSIGVHYEVLFEFDKMIGTDANYLVYSKKHGLSPHSVDYDNWLHKVYNDNWWWHIEEKL